MIRRSCKLYLLLIISISTGLLYTLNLITTNGVLRQHQQPIPINISPQSQSIDLLSHNNDGLTSQDQPSINTNSISNTHHKQVGPLKTLFRGDLPTKLDAGFPEQNLLEANGGNQNGGNQNPAGAPVLLHSAGGVDSSSHVQHYGHYGPPNTKVKIPYKLVHIDLKGAPPKLAYLKSLFRTIGEAGGNGILLEYEDMFPFRGALNGTSHKFHFNEDEVRELISSAVENNLEVIPLVQTFGHLEFILKLDKFRPLRELDEFPQEICPSNDVAWNLVTTIIDQVLELHKSHGRPPRYIHIGCDEVYHIGECDRCKGKDVKDLFLDHVIRVSKYVKTKHGITPIIWDDMLRKFYAEELVKSDIGMHAELMMWDYTEDVDRLLPPYLWPMYGQVFPNIWAASAFKGAFGETLYKVDIQRHAMNHLSWLSVLGREQRFIKNLRGVALTGWSRYDHFSVLCELLPVAVPSLILSLQILIYQNLEKASTEMFKVLKCDGSSSLLSKLDDCQWDGAELSSALGTLQFYQEQTFNLLKTHRRDKGWLTGYNLHHNYSSPWRLGDPIQSATQYLMSLQNFETNLRVLLRKYFENHVVEEWIEQKIGSITQDLNSLIEDATALAARRSWPTRPI